MDHVVPSLPQRAVEGSEESTHRTVSLEQPQVVRHLHGGPEVAAERDVLLLRQGPGKLLIRRIRLDDLEQQAQYSDPTLRPMDPRPPGSTHPHSVAFRLGS